MHQRARHRLDVRPPQGHRGDEITELVELVRRDELGELDRRVHRERVPEIAHLAHRARRVHVPDPWLREELFLAAVPNGVEIREPAQGRLDGLSRPCARILLRVHDRHVLRTKTLERHDERLARVFTVREEDAGGIADEARILLLVDRELTDVAGGEAGHVPVPVVRGPDARAALRRHRVHHQDHLFVERLHLDHHVAHAERPGRRAIREAPRQKAHQLADFARREIAHDARAGLHFERFDRLEAEARVLFVTTERRLEERDAEVFVREPTHRTIAAETLVRVRELAGRDGRQRRQIERQTEARDDLGEPAHGARAGAPHRFEQRVLRGEMRAAANGADDQAREDHAGVNAVLHDGHVKLRDARLVHARDVLPGGGEHRGDDVGDVDVESDHAGLDAARLHAGVRGVELLGRDLEHALQDRAVDVRVGDHANAAPADERRVGDLLVAAHVRFDDEVLELHFVVVRHLLHQPLARGPRARRGHVLSRRVAGLVEKIDVHHAPEDHGLDRHELGVARHAPRLLAQRVDVLADPVGEEERAVERADDEERHAHHALTDDARGDAAGAADRRRAARGRGDERAFGRRQRRAEESLRLVAAEEQRPREAYRHFDGADEVLDVAGELLGAEARRFQRRQRLLRFFAEPHQALDARLFGVDPARRDLRHHHRAPLRRAAHAPWIGPGVAVRHSLDRVPKRGARLVVVGVERRRLCLAEMRAAQDDEVFHASAPADADQRPFDSRAARRRLRARRKLHAEAALGHVDHARETRRPGDAGVERILEEDLLLVRAEDEAAVLPPVGTYGARISSTWKAR